jgi:beta-lactamase regulating signal transducer with metallopeptidase domain
VSKPIALLLHENIVGPMTFGVVRPVIVFPPDARTWSGDDLLRALTHELEHIRRRDWLILCIARTVCALYWFHPLVWMSWRQLRLEAERASDDAVVRRAEPTAYADQLVALAQRVTATRGRPLLAMANHGDLPARVTAVLDCEQARGRAGALLCVAAVVGALVLLGVMAPLRAVAVTRASALRAQSSRPWCAPG